jgi:tetratricopeptide (TPR) repeat protein
MDQQEKGGWFSSGSPVFRIKSGVYCCYNSFALVDVRVEVRIPGGVNVYGVNRAGKRVVVADAAPIFWSELFVCATLRAILADKEYPPSPAGTRRFDPLPDLPLENQFLEAIKVVFPRAWQLGPDPDAQVPTLTSNVLAHALVKFFGKDSGRWNVLIALWKDLLPLDPSIASLLAQAYEHSTSFSMKAAQLMYSTLVCYPTCSSVLYSQVHLLRQRGKFSLALETARKLVNCAPLEFKAWAALTECYTAIQDWHMALLALNSCPMFAHVTRDNPLMPDPERIHFPDVVPDAADYADNDLSVLTPLRAESLRGTFKRAYTLLGKMVESAGWENLLSHRANVFVMEDEYRQVKEEELMPAQSLPSLNSSQDIQNPTNEGEGIEKETNSGEKIKKNAFPSSEEGEETEDPKKSPGASDEGKSAASRVSFAARTGSKLLSAFSHKVNAMTYFDENFHRCLD